MAPQIDVHIREVGLRDGIQNISTFLPTEAKTAWISAEFAAGVREIEVCSFVPVKLIPQFADAMDVVRHARTLQGLNVSALVPNSKGFERAVEAGVDEADYVISVSESHNKSNVRRTPDESVEDFRRIMAMRNELPPDRRPKVVAGLATAFGCTFEGKIAESAVRRLATALAEAGADELALADTVGFADPAAVRKLFAAVAQDLPGMTLHAHFHDTRGLGLANVVAALEAGVRHFDSSLGGLGGCQFAPGATGNINTEDLAFMLESMGLRTGVDVEKLVGVRGIITRGLPDEALTGSISRAGLPKGFHAARAS
ncbi:MAG: hydroxymethylglutaryl-CoA lyase [Candidatus Lambdaproteobacteria bacterium]|nr:hydroxymethylglutaryl-CoA lyase [Candidatus Lambdaproteobacteria bacterium]